MNRETFRYEPVGDTGNITHCVRARFPSWYCDSQPGAGDRCPLHVNSWALGWSQDMWLIGHAMSLNCFCIHFRKEPARNALSRTPGLRNLFLYILVSSSSSFSSSSSSSSLSSLSSSTAFNAVWLIYRRCDSLIWSISQERESQDRKSTVSCFSPYPVQREFEFSNQILTELLLLSDVMFEQLAFLKVFCLLTLHPVWSSPYASFNLKFASLYPA